MTETTNTPIPETGPYKDDKALENQLRQMTGTDLQSAMSRLAHSDSEHRDYVNETDRDKFGDVTEIYAPNAHSDDSALNTSTYGRRTISGDAQERADAQYDGHEIDEDHSNVSVTVAVDPEQGIKTIQQVEAEETAYWKERQQEEKQTQQRTSEVAHDSTEHGEAKKSAESRRHWIKVGYTTERIRRLVDGANIDKDVAFERFTSIADDVVWLEEKLAKLHDNNEPYHFDGNGGRHEAAAILAKLALDAKPINIPSLVGALDRLGSIYFYDDVDEFGELADLIEKYKGQNYYKLGDPGKKDAVVSNLLQIAEAGATYNPATYRFDKDTFGLFGSINDAEKYKETLDAYKDDLARSLAAFVGSDREVDQLVHALRSDDTRDQADAKAKVVAN